MADKQILQSVENVLISKVVVSNKSNMDVAITILVVLDLVDVIVQKSNYSIVVARQNIVVSNTYFSIVAVAERKSNKYVVSNTTFFVVVVEMRNLL